MTFQPYSFAHLLTVFGVTSKASAILFAETTCSGVPESVEVWVSAVVGIVPIYAYMSA